jgi:CBS domain-containing protein
MKTVGMLLQGKGNQVWAVNPEHTVHDALGLMAEKNIGAVLVLEQGEVCGIFSERDYARRGEVAGNQAVETQVREVMTGEVICVTPDETIETCMSLMTNHRFRHLPVVEEDRLIGIISIGDVVKAIISDQAFMIEQLERYITLPR